MNKRQRKKNIQKYNKKLIQEYPFLLPRNRWSDEVVENFNYSYTELDAMPEGWRKAFGLLMCQQIKEALVKENLLDNYRIMQIKEKYGSLRWYDCGSTLEIHDIIRKFEYLSEHICIRCGKFDVSMFDDGWMNPYCDKCFIDKKHFEQERYQKIAKRELPPINDKEILEKYRLEDDKIETVLKIESISKNGSSWREIDLSKEIEYIKRRK